MSKTPNPWNTWTGEVYACVHAPEFPQQALLRLRQKLAGRPVAVLEGHAATERVCAANAHARALGVANDMTRAEAEMVPHLALLRRNPREEEAARAVMLGAAHKYTPAAETRHTPLAAVCVLDLKGTRRLWGPPDQLAHRLLRELASIHLTASVAVSRNFHTACTLAQALPGVTAVAPGTEAQALAPLLLGALPLLPPQAELLGFWGIQTLGALAALPERELVARMGQSARQLRALARGESTHLFQPTPAQWKLQERYEFDAPLNELPSLLFVLSPMLEQLLQQAAERAMALASLTLTLELEGGLTHIRHVRPALATRDKKLLLKLLQLDLSSHGPPAAVTALVLRGEPGEIKGVQLGLYMPPTPEPSRLDVTLARLRALVGDQAVGSPRLLDTHHPDGFRMEPFQVGRPGKPAPAAEESRLPAMRRLRPPALLAMRVEAQRPAAFAWEGSHWEVVLASGPWRASGAWWDTETWVRESWDVVAETTAAEPLYCRLFADGLRQRWFLEAVYD